MEVEMEQTNQFRGNHQLKSTEEEIQLEEIEQLRVGAHAGKGAKRALQQANDRFRRANRDLGELAAFIAATLTTVTAVEAVINIAIDKIELPRELLRTAFDGYILFLAVLLLVGGVRFGWIMHKRARAEKEVDHAKQLVYKFCPPEEWSKLEE
jgi:hypothetical protein